MAEEASSTKQEQEQQHIVLFPFMAQGHIIPFLSLALNLEQRTQNRNRNTIITIINTPLNIKKLRSSLPPNSSINLLEIPFNSSDHGLPPNTENTDVLPYNLVIRLLEASFSLKPAFQNLLQNLKNQRQRICVIGDMFFGWAARVAKDMGVFHVIFTGSGGYGLACYYSLWLNLPHTKLKHPNHEFEFDFLLPDFPEAGSLHTTQLPNNIAEADGQDSWSLYQKTHLSQWVHSHGILFNTVEHFDSLGMQYFARKLNRPVWAVGPVLLSTGTGSRGKGGGVSPEICREWLDRKPLNSVLFVCFGSMNTISAKQMMELAMALEGSERDFIWVVRPPIGHDINSEFRANEWLPRGFVERVEESNKGLIVYDWAPQVEILSHEAVSVFLSHCGWNSVMEALSHGVPILGWPMAAEQFFNCKMLEERVGVCVEVARGKKREVKHEDILNKIEMVMSDEGKGKEMRNKAGRIRDIIRNALKEEDGYKGSSLQAMDDFLSSAAANTDKSNHTEE